jgi:membrane-associated protease RseP (regulator of RpoE activity)
MQPSVDTFIFDTIVARVFRIEDITLGTPQQNFIVRYRGHLLNDDSVQAYDRLAEQLQLYGVTPLFRWDGERHAVILVKGMPKPNSSNPIINLVLFILTLASVLLTGALYGMDKPLPQDAFAAALELMKRGWPFAVSMIAILGSHEFGHYLVGRYHGVHVTLPYFIPLPFSPFGTMGAFINMKEPPKNRRVLLDIGIAGPLAGIIVAIPVLWIGLKLSAINVLPAIAQVGGMEGNSLLYLLMKYLAFGQLLPAPVNYGGLSPLLYWFRYFLTGQPFPFGGHDVTLGAVAWAGWAGILVTGLNLIPVGQLDGGHVFYVLFGRERARRLFPVILVLMVSLGFFWSGWWFWAALIFLLGRAYAEPLDQITPLDGRRKFIAILGLVLFILTFTPVPLI